MDKPTAEDKRRAEKAAIDARIKELVDRAPPLTPEQIIKLRAIFSTVNRHTAPPRSSPEPRALH